MGEYLLDVHRVFHAGDHLDGAAAFTTHLNIDIENSLQSLRPGHGRATFDRRVLPPLIGRFGVATPTSLGGRYQRTMFAVRGQPRLHTTTPFAASVQYQERPATSRKIDAPLGGA